MITIHTAGMPRGPRLLPIPTLGLLLLFMSPSFAGPPAQVAAEPWKLDPRNITRDDVHRVVRGIRGNVIIVDWHGTWDYDNIQDALDAATDGDTIIVLPSVGSPDGAYVENVVFPDASITLQSLLPEDPGIVSATVIDGSAGSGSGSVVTIGGTSTLLGFTVRNGHSNIVGGGVLCWGTQQSRIAPSSAIRLRRAVESPVLAHR